MSQAFYMNGACHYLLAIINCRCDFTTCFMLTCMINAYLWLQVAKDSAGKWFQNMYKNSQTMYKSFHCSSNKVMQRMWKMPFFLKRMTIFEANSKFMSVSSNYFEKLSKMLERWHFSSAVMRRSSFAMHSSCQ